MIGKKTLTLESVWEVKMVSAIMLMLCISTCVWVLRAPKTWSKYFLTAFNLLSWWSMFYRNFTSKRRKNVQKVDYIGTPSGWSTPKPGELPVGVPQICLARFTFAENFKKYFDQLSGEHSRFHMVNQWHIYYKMHWISVTFISEYNQTYHTSRLVIIVYILLCVTP